MGYFGLVLLMLWTVGTEAQYNPNHAHHQCSRLSPLPCCPHGFPLPRVRCPMARCPMGFSCHTHVLNRWGVCCRTTLVINQMQTRNTGKRIRQVPSTMLSVARPMPRNVQTCTAQSNRPCCQFGQPLPRIDCQTQRCPNGYTCFTHAAGQWAVCCAMSQQQTSRTVVMVAGPLGIGQSGPGARPGQAPVAPSIPQEPQIIEITTCSNDSPTPCCPSATPIPGSDCRFGSCPAGSTCNVHVTDAWAVCCPAPGQPRPACSRRSNVACCEAGQPLAGIQCRVQACPPGYTCNSHINNRWAVCCQDTNTAATTQTCSVNNANACCPRGEMVPGTQCRTRPCLNNQYCHSNPQGLWAVCCQDTNGSPIGVQPPALVPVPSCTVNSPTPCCSRGEPLNRAQCQTRGCPVGYTCTESTVAGWTACCPTEQTPAPVPVTTTNTCSRQSPRPCCRRGNPLQQCQFKKCPSGFECHTHITNAWSVCCAEIVNAVPQVAVRPASPGQCSPQSVQPCCAIGRPVPGIDCRTQSCPFGYTCSTNPMGLWAVCCTQLTS
ncbi:progranulin-like [Ylistrum balloti]|uniref:progranulin-like n=1 Tax=Ylistrum balloti TaxID=509963 RepID=UPI0029058BF1|nr:progranulin-like [Ylistrum balloti]